MLAHRVLPSVVLAAVQAGDGADGAAAAPAAETHPRAESERATTSDLLYPSVVHICALGSDCLRHLGSVFGPSPPC